MEMRIPPHLTNRGGVWYVIKVVGGVRLKASTGVKVGGEPQLKQAIQKQREIEAGWDKQRYGTKTIPTFGEWWHTYEETYSVQKARPKQDASTVVHALERWKRLRLDRITKSMCEKLLNDRLKQISQDSVSRERGLLQAIFQRAIEDELLERNPFKAIERVKGAVRQRVLTLEEQAVLHRTLSPQFQRWLTFMIGTGLRLEEARAVRPEHLDRQKRLLAVQAYAAKYKKAREVPLYPAVEQAIDQQQGEMGRMWDRNPQNYRAMLSDAVIRANKTLKAEGSELVIPHLYPHALRHTFATRYLQANGNIYKLSKILGHASVKITEEQYVHLVSTDLVEHSLELDLGLNP